MLNWTGYQDSYNVQYRTAGGRETLLYEGFDDETLPSGWTTSGLASNSGILEGFFAFVRNGTTPQYLITPELSVITNIDLDHTKFLGDTRAKIAYEKA